MSHGSGDETVGYSIGDIERIVFLLSLFLTIIAGLLGVQLPPMGRPL